MKKVTEIGYDAKGADFDYAYPCFNELLWRHTCSRLNIRRVFRNILRLVEDQMVEEMHETNYWR